MMSVLGELDAKMPKGQKLFNGGNITHFTDYGKYVADIVAADIMKYGVVKALFPDEELVEFAQDGRAEYAEDLKYKAMFATMYSSGMRVSEVIHLHYDDISRTNMQIHVRDTKNRMDRYTILSKRNLDLLTEYWFRKGRPKGILFPNKFTGQYLTVGTLEQVMRRSAAEAELPKGVSPHSLRHSFASHLMEAGVEQRHIQALLGHRDPKSTEVYLHVSNKTIMGIRNPFDREEGGCNG